MQIIKTLLVLALLVTGCGDQVGLTVKPRIDDFPVSPQDSAKIRTAADKGSGAEATYSYDEAKKKLTLTISASSFRCDIKKGTLVAIVTELTATTMDWKFEVL